MAKTTRTFKAYDYKGQLVLCISTHGDGAYAAERGAFQERLNRFELGWVDISSDNPHEPAETMRARSQP